MTETAVWYLMVMKYRHKRKGLPFVVLEVCNHNNNIFTKLEVNAFFQHWAKTVDYSIWKLVSERNRLLDLFNIHVPQFWDKAEKLMFIDLLLLLVYITRSVSSSMARCSNINFSGEMPVDIPCL